jgi:DNA-binding transcriptional ArsR family regulator
MSIAGPDALKSIEEALRDIRREETESARRLARSVELTAKLREQEAELFRQLTADEDAGEARGALEAALGETEAALAAHEASLAGLDEQVAALDAHVTSSSASRAELLATMAGFDAELHGLAERVRPALQRDASYADAVERARAAGAIAEASLAKTARAEADSGRNGRTYRDDPVFMYLWGKAYGTTGYRANFAVSWLDSKVAGLIGYGAARLNFSALNDIPMRLREHAERQQDLAREAARHVAALEHAAIDAAGGKGARDARDAALARMREADAEIVALQDQRDEAVRAQRDLAQGSEPGFAAAATALTDALNHPQLVARLAEARPLMAHEAIVQQIDDLHQRTLEQDLEVREEKARLKLLCVRRRELEDIQYELKAQGLDSPGASFSRDALVGEILNDFLRGEISAAQYWQLWRDNQSWAVGEWIRSNAGGTSFSRPRDRKAA